MAVLTWRQRGQLSGQPITDIAMSLYHLYTERIQTLMRRLQEIRKYHDDQTLIQRTPQGTKYLITESFIVSTKLLYCKQVMRLLDRGFRQAGIDSGGIVSALDFNDLYRYIASLAISTRYLLRFHIGDPAISLMTLDILRGIAADLDPLVGDIFCPELFAEFPDDEEDN